MVSSFVVWRIVVLVATALLGVVVSLAANAIDLTAPKQTERRLLGQVIDRPLAASADPQIANALAELRGMAHTHGKVRVIVGVRAAFAPEGLLSSVQTQSQRGEIADVQRYILSKLPKQAADEVTHFQFIPFSALAVDADELDTLAAMPEVTDIQEDRLSAPTLAESVPLIRANAAWAAGYTGSGWSVAVLDVGVDKTHPFLSGKVVAEACYSTTNTINGVTSVCPGGVSASTALGSGVNCSLSIEGCDHGTHVAGIAAGLGTTFSGVAKGANVIAIQVFSRVDNVATCGSSSPCARSYDSDRINALQRVYALRTSFNIAAVNMSIGSGRYYSQSACDTANGSERAAIDLLRSAGIATVIASGNNGYTDSASAPGCLSSAVIVGATFDAAGYNNSCDGWNGGASSVDEVACFSNSASFLDLLAPGADIISSIPGGGFASKSGTSMAAPHVAGCWAILKQAKPTATVDEIEQSLKNTGVPVQDWRSGQVKPRIDCKAALDNLLGAGGVVPNLTVSTFSVSPITVSAGGAVNFAAAVRNAGAGSSSATTLRYYESLGSTWSEMTFCRTSIIGLAAGATSNQSCAATAPPTAITKYFYAAVDPVSGETVTTDNVSNTITLTVTSAPIPTYLLTVTKAGTGSGTVTGPGINCGSDCAESYPSSTFVTLTATPSAGTTFTGWSGACSAGNCQLTMNGAKSVTANFVLTPSNLTISSFSASPGAVSVDGAVHLAATVRNAGAGSSSASTLRYYYWTGTVWSEITFCRGSIGPLAPGATSSQSCGIIPSSTPGTFYYDVAVDTVPGESVTTDNFADYVAVTVNIGTGYNYQGLWWNAPANSESGWGINFAHQGDVIFATWFTYDAAGKAWWLTMTANKTAQGVYSGQLIRTNGTPFSTFVPPVTTTVVGTGTLTFTSGTTGTFAYSVNDGANVASQTKAIVLQTFGPVPTCVWGAQSDLTKATNYQDLWWATGGAESGWGVNLIQQGTTIFATWFTYDINHNPVWYSGQASLVGPGRYSGSLLRTTGPPFSAAPFNPSQVGRTTVGTVTFIFTDGNAGTFAYQVNDGANVATQTKAITREVFRAPGTVCQ